MENIPNKPSIKSAFNTCEEYFHQSWCTNFVKYINDYYNTRERSTTIKGEHKSN